MGSDQPKVWEVPTLQDLPKTGYDLSFLWTGLAPETFSDDGDGGGTYHRLWGGDRTNPNLQMHPTHTEVGPGGPSLVA